ncbi:phasin family protein [Verticiella sediminum]|uniref:Phasin family protein n=1 Tax=Verticiella sediminum TaxID=1247510 RepID=A0A556A936_9BURK|nr:TIGR01841 family phasin [Verticiella sediminum]TSH89392.1 phasin family protein [Verticiella sediminum]
MSAVPPQILANQKASLDTLLAIQTAAFSGFEKLVDLNLRVAKASFDESAQKAQEMMSLEDTQQAFAYASSLAQPSADKLMAYSKHVYDIVSGVQTEIAKLAETQMAEGQKHFADAVEQFSKMAPAGSESAVALMKSSLATATSAYDSFSKAAKQAAEVTESNINAAANATFEVAEAAKPAPANRTRRTA